MAIQALGEIMKQLILLHDALIRLSQQKTQVLIDNNVEELNRIVHKEAQLVRQVAECENRRAETVNRFLISKGFRPTPKITITEIVKLMFRSEDKERIQGLQVELLAKLNELKLLNERNTKLIEQSLAFIDYSIDLLSGPPEDEVFYQNPLTQKGGSSKAMRFDTRA